MTTDYPWDGKVVLKPQVEGAAKFGLRLRVPGWCEGATVAVGGEKIASRPSTRLLVAGREWKDGDEVELDLPMPVRRIAANPNVKDDLGQLAIQRGPLVYCLEACDQGEPLASLYLPRDAELKAEKADRPAGRRRGREGVGRDGGRAGLDAILYQPVARSTPVPITAIPYYAWDNRQAGAMKVWLPVAPRTPAAGGPGDAGEGEPVVRQRQLPAVGHQRRPGAARAAESSPPRSATGGPITAATSGSSTPGRNP